MSKETLAAGHERKKAFLRAYIAEGSYLSQPISSLNQWHMQRRIGLQYGLKDDKTLEELGNRYGISRERARQLNHDFLDNACHTSSPKLQAQYPRETIPDRKPLSQKLRERHSETHGGISLRVKELVEKGINDPKQISNTLGISTQDLARTRITLDGWGVNVPRTLQSRKEVFERIEKENDDKKLQEFLDSLSANSLRGFLQRDSSHEILTTVSVIAREKGFRVNIRQVRFIAETIRKAAIPIRQIERLDKKGRLLGSYYIVYTKHADRIAEVLRND